MDEWIRRTIEVASSALFLTIEESPLHGWVRIDDQVYAVLAIPDATHLVLGVHRSKTAHLN